MPSNDLWDVLASFREDFRKIFAETAVRLLEKADVQKERRLELADELASAFLTWGFQHKIPGDPKVMREINKNSNAMQSQLKEINSAYKSYDANSLAGDIASSRFRTAQWLNDDLQFARPPTDIDGVIAALSVISEVAKSWLMSDDVASRSHKCSRGRRLGR